MPVPMMPPMPNAIRDGMPSARTNPSSDASFLIVGDRLGCEHPSEIHVMTPNVASSNRTLHFTPAVASGFTSGGLRIDSMVRR